MYFQHLTLLIPYWLYQPVIDNLQNLNQQHEAIELIPQEAQLYQERGRVHLLMGDKAGAAEDMKKAIELAPEKENLISGNFNNFEKSNLQTGIY